MASCCPMALFSRRSAVNYRAFADDITRCEVCTYVLSHIGVPHAPSISLCLSCKIHLFASNPLCGADLSHPTCAAYLLSLLHNEWLSGALTVRCNHVCPVLKNWEYIPKTGASYDSCILMLPPSSLHLYKMLFSHVFFKSFFFHHSDFISQPECSNNKKAF